MPSKKPASLPVEILEPRTLLSSAFVNVNISRMAGNQAEGSIVVDRAAPSHVFAVSNIEVGDGLLFGSSTDGGATWTHRLIGNDNDGLTPACCDPSMAADSYGNLFLTYLSADADQVVVLLSADSGQTFHAIDTIHGDVDQPTLTSGPGGIWLSFQKGGVMTVTGAPVTGLNQVGAFTPPTRVRGSGNGNFGDIAVGPDGEVMITYERQAGRTQSKILINVDPDGFGPAPFGKPVVAATTHVGNFDLLPAQPGRGIDAEAGLAFDRSSDVYRGRAYLVYTDQFPATSANSDIFLRYSDNQGITWSNPIRVNDDLTTNSQLLPRISEDDITGQVAVGWYDARNDAGSGGPGDTNNKPDDDAAYYATLITPAADGLLVSPNQQISAGVSNADDAANSIDLGDYTGLDFYGGTFRPLWFDNSDSTGDNPAGALRSLDVYTATVSASAFSVPSIASLGGLSEPSGPVAALYLRGSANPGSVRGGRSYTITVSYSDPAGLSLSSLGNSNLLIAGPGTFVTNAQFVRARLQAHGTVALATYRVINPSGNWSAADDGTYTIALEPNQILDSRSRFSTSGTLGTFVVAIGLSSSGSASGSGRDPDHH